MSQTTLTAEIPRGNPQGFVKYLPKDLLSGFLVFLIALPLCLGIATASGFPPIAGVFTAIVGSILTSFLSNSELTIKGPAAGLIVIVIGAVTDFRALLPEDMAEPAAMMAAYQMALAVGFTAAIFQIGFGLFKLGILGEFFPTTVVHGMLSAIGVIIISKQIHIVLGVMGVKGEPLELLAEVPHSFVHMNPEIAVIGFVSLLLLFGIPLLKIKALKRVPLQMVVILVAVPLGIYYNLEETHTYTFVGAKFELSSKYLVEVPENLFKAMAHPDFTALKHPVAWKWVAMFALIGTLESLLSAKAVDLLDPWKRKTNMNRDLLAVGVANLAAASIGGLPMISEIVRSKANIDNGARTRFADMWHGIFLLAFVALVPGLIHKIPNAALAAMLVYTGFRLASPQEFKHAYHIGREQLLIFVGTLVGVLATDLLIGVFIGIGIKFAIHLINGVPVTSLFKTYLEVEETGPDTSTIRAQQSAVFSNWIPFKRQIEDLGLVQRRNVVIDLSNTKLVDHSVMEKLQELKADFDQEGLRLELIGLDDHRRLSHHESSARKRGLPSMRRMTMVANKSMQDLLENLLLEHGASSVTILPCSAVARTSKNGTERTEQCRLEAIVTSEAADAVLIRLRRDVLPTGAVEVSIEQINAMPKQNAIDTAVSHSH